MWVDIQIFQHLYDMGTKKQQDIFLSSFIEPQEIKRRRSRKESSVSKSKKFVYQCSILVSCQRSEVCKKAFVSLFGDVGVKRLRCLQSYILQDKTPEDMRGIGITNIPLPNKDVLPLNEHMPSFPYHVNYFNTHFDLSFGPPQIDTYVECEELIVRLKSPSLNVVAKRVAEAELQIH
ncbi:hypothetical protein PR048_032515 [Dryococelus australis]|uniref:Uncharacterized protein n=1 Tax=Dryococelus australis TaxID=614101 RepID=A0ABQ9G6H8_9NEOP|nr:hypothetical protein PR048_032515 [Dryococelus australis]